MFIARFSQDGHSCRRVVLTDFSQGWAGSDAPWRQRRAPGEERDRRRAMERETQRSSLCRFETRVYLVGMAMQPPGVSLKSISARMTSSASQSTLLHAGQRFGYSPGSMPLPQRQKPGTSGLRKAAAGLPTNPILEKFIEAIFPGVT